MSSKKLKEELDLNKYLSNLTKPEHPVILVSGNMDREMNFMAAGWVMRTSFKPPLMAVSVGHSRHSHRLMQDEEEFVLSYPVSGQEDLIKAAGSLSGSSVDKFSEIDEEYKRGSKVNLPVFTRARVNFECLKRDFKKTGDHTIFIGEVLFASGNPGRAPLLNTGNYRYREYSI